MSADPINDDQLQAAYTAENPKSKKGWLTSAFMAAKAYAPSALIGVGVGLTVKTCALALLCTTGAPAIATAVTACAVSGLLAGVAKESWNYYRHEKKQDQAATFMNKGRLKRCFMSAAVSGIFGSLAFAFGDEIKEAAGIAYDKAQTFFGNTPADPPVTISAQPTAPGATAPEGNIIEQDTPAPVETKPPSEAIAEPIATPETEAETIPAAEPAPDAAAEPAPDATADNTVADQPAPQVVPVEFVTADTYTVQRGDNLWAIVKDHYGLNSNAEIQRFTDAAAEANGLTEGTEANTILPGRELVLPAASVIENHRTLVLDWEALDAETRERLSQRFSTPAGDAPTNTATNTVNTAPSTGEQTAPPKAAHVTPPPASETIPDVATEPVPTPESSGGLSCSPIIQGEDISFVCSTANDTLSLISGDRIIIEHTLPKPGMR